MSETSIGPVALTMGDPAGIGPDITLSVWAKRADRPTPPFLYVGDPALLAARAKLLGQTVPICETDCPGPSPLSGRRCPFGRSAPLPP